MREAGGCEGPKAHLNESDAKNFDAVALEKALSSESHTLEVSRDLKSRNFCILALVLGICVGVTSLVVGCEIIASGKVKLPDFLRGK